MADMAVILDICLEAIFAIFLVDALILSTKFRDDPRLGSEGEGQNGFSRWPPSWTLDWNIFSEF